jgi:hypothetical protein
MPQPWSPTPRVYVWDSTTGRTSSVPLLKTLEDGSVVILNGTRKELLTPFDWRWKVIQRAD